MSIQLMTDGGADIPESLHDVMDIIVVPLYLHFRNVQFTSGVDIDIEEFYRRVENGGELPRSSAPSPSDFYHAYKKVDSDRPIIMLSMTKGLSSTYENAVAGKNLLLEEESERQIAVINTKTATGGIALLMHEANEKIQEEISFGSLVDHLHERCEQTATLFMLNTLDNLIRGEKKSIRSFIDQIGTYTKNVENKVLSLTHCHAEVRAKKLIQDILEKYPFKRVMLTETGPLISTYAGEGAFVMSFFKED